MPTQMQTIPMNFADAEKFDAVAEKAETRFDDQIDTETKSRMRMRKEQQKDSNSRIRASGGE